MSTNLTLDADGIAVMRATFAASSSKSTRALNYRTDSDGTPIAVSLPGPARLAGRIALADVDAYRRGSALLTRPQGSDEDPEPLDLADVTEALSAALRALPERPDAGQAYCDLQLAAASAGPIFAAYVADVVRAYVRSLPAVPRRTAEGQDARPAPLTAVERQRVARARRRAEEWDSARWALTTYLAPDEDSPPPGDGARVPGADLHEFASEVLAAAVEEYEDAAEGEWQEVRHDFLVPAPVRPRLVSKRVLYAVAAAEGHKVTRPGNVVVVTIVKRVTAAVRRAVTAWRTRSRRPETDEALRDLGATVKAARPRLSWRDRPLDPETEAALRRLAERVIDAEEGNQ